MTGATHEHALPPEPCSKVSQTTSSAVHSSPKALQTSAECWHFVHGSSGPLPFTCTSIMHMPPEPCSKVSQTTSSAVHSSPKALQTSAECWHFVHGSSGPLPFTCTSIMHMPPEPCSKVSQTTSSAVHSSPKALQTSAERWHLVHGPSGTLHLPLCTLPVSPLGGHLDLEAASNRPERLLHLAHVGAVVGVGQLAHRRLADTQPVGQLHLGDVLRPHG